MGHPAARLDLTAPIAFTLFSFKSLKNLNEEKKLSN